MQDYTKVEEIETKMGPCVLDACTSHSRDTKYFKTMTLHWQVKLLMGKIFLDNKEERNELLL